MRKSVEMPEFSWKKTDVYISFVSLDSSSFSSAQAPVLKTDLKDSSVTKDPSPPDFLAAALTRLAKVSQYVRAKGKLFSNFSKAFP